MTISWKDETHTELFPVSATLQDVLEGFDAKVPVPAAATAPPAASSSSSSSAAAAAAAAGPPAGQTPPRWSGWTGVPAPEVTAQFEVHIHVAGWMSPVLEVGARKVQGDELRSLRLSALGVQSDTPQPAKLKLRLSHTYTPPKRSEAEQKEVMDNFQRKYNALMGGGAFGAAPASSSSTASSAAAAPAAAACPHTGAASRVAGAVAGACPARPLHRVQFADEEEGEDIEAGSDAEDEPVAAAPVEIPADRRIALLHALPGMLAAPELPEEFYEVTDEDSLAYARALRLEAGRARAAGGLAPTELPLGSGHASAAALHRTAVVAHTALSHMEPSDLPGAAAAAAPGGLLDSARLPPVAKRRPRRRACHATLIRVRLPGHLYAEGLFRADETPADLYRWLDALLLPDATTAATPAAAQPAAAEGAALPPADSSAGAAAASASKHPDYYLYISPPRQQLSRHSRLTFAQLGLLPAALVHFGRGAQAQQAQGAGSFAVEPDTPEQVAARERNPAQGLLRDEWLGRVRKIVPPPDAVRTAAAGPAPLDEEKKSAAQGGEGSASDCATVAAAKPAAEDAAVDSATPASPSANAMD